MMNAIPVEYILLISSSLILVSILLAKLSDNLGVPALLLFLAVGMLMGSDGIGGLSFDDPELAMSIGTIALVIILFAGGLDTRWSAVRPVVWQSMSLATAGVVLTATLVGVFATYALGLSWLEGMLLGAIISSTDAAAVFSVLRSKNVSLKGTLSPLLELESGSNDPMAVFLTVVMIGLVSTGAEPGVEIAGEFLLQMGLGAGMGIVAGKGLALLLNRLRFSYEGFYPVFTFAFAGLTYSATWVLGGSGFLAVYIAGLIVGNSDIIQKRTLLRFFDGLAWLGQIGMFLTLGLLAFPIRIVPLIDEGLLMSAFLIFAARPVSVFISLSFARLDWREKVFVSWVGLRGAVPIILATFPLVARVSNAEMIFDLVFFIVLTSALLQGWSIPVVAKLLGVAAPAGQRRKSPLEFTPSDTSDSDLQEFIVPYNSDIVGRQIVELGLPADCLIVLVTRNEEFVVPSGSTVLEEGDALLVLINKTNLSAVRRILSAQKTATTDDPVTPR